MKTTRYLFFLLTAGLFASCTQSPEQRIVGNWSVVKVCSYYFPADTIFCATYPDPEYPLYKIVYELYEDGNFLIRYTNADGSQFIGYDGTWELVGESLLKLWYEDDDCTFTYTVLDFTATNLSIRFSDATNGCQSVYDELYLEKE